MAKKKAKRTAKKRSAKKVKLGLKQLLREIDTRLKAATRAAEKGTTAEGKKKARKAVAAMRRVRLMTASDDCPFRVMGEDFNIE